MADIHPVKRDSSLNSTVYDYITLAPTPLEEECTQVRPDTFTLDDQKIECNALINQMLRQCTPPPANAYYFILKNTGHDFGCYCEVAVRFNMSDEDAETWAFEMEGAIPGHWDKEAINEMIAAGHSKYNNPSKLNLKVA
jgi:hypothetical protein